MSVLHDIGREPIGSSQGTERLTQGAAHFVRHVGSRSKGRRIALHNLRIL
jgi:hypothetical protein